MKIDLDPESWAPSKLAEAKPSPRPLTYGDQTIVSVVLRLLTEEAGKVAGNLTGGTLVTIEAYREAVGELRGLTTALRIVRAAEREASGDEPAPAKEPPLYGV